MILTESLILLGHICQLLPSVFKFFFTEVDHPRSQGFSLEGGSGKIKMAEKLSVLIKST